VRAADADSVAFTDFERRFHAARGFRTTFGLQLIATIFRKQPFLAAN
jgi:hypothetical protein